MDIYRERECYNEGFEDGLNYKKESYISQEELMESFDKFLDIINEHKRVLVLIKNHFEGISINNKPLKTKVDKDHNIFQLQNMIEVILKQSTKKEQSHVTTQR